jgi:hypothetical protein
MIAAKQGLVILGLGVVLLECDAFVIQKQRVALSTYCSASSGKDDDSSEASGSTNNKGIFAGISNFFEELDAFIDDASARRLGAGAAFYGKRKSNFYGTEDRNRKSDRTMSDPTEDYQGPTSTGLFQWMQDEDGQMRPVTRGKNKIIERPPEYWDRFYEQQANKKEE